MPNTYRCPKCKSHLLLDDKVVISAKAKDGSEGLISLSPELGNYTIYFPPTINCKSGDLLTLFCPVCHQNLSSSKHINLGMVYAEDESGKRFEIFFSQIVDEHSTVKMIGDHVELFGDDVYKYQDHFDKPRQMF